jgi:DNA-binding MarR family transcriptional regulator
MNRTKEKYHVKIDSEFLFDKNRVFKSRYTPWIYIYLKFEYLYYLQHAPYKTINLKTNEIAKFFYIDRATVHRSIQQLIKHGLIEKKERDMYILKAERIEYDEEGGENYLMIFKNLFIDIFLNGGTVNEVAVYYYMILDNRHYAFDYMYLESDLNQTKISKALNLDSRKTKAILAKLLNLGLITVDDESKKYMTKYSREGTVKVEKRLEKKSEGFEDAEKGGKKLPIMDLFKANNANGGEPTIQIVENGKMTPGNRISRISTNNIHQTVPKRMEYANSYR